jgi:hypothetical protein
VEAPVEVDLQHQVELRLLELRERGVAQDAGVVDHDVDPAERVQGGLHDRLAALPGVHAVVVGDRLAARGDDLLDDGVGHLRALSAAVAAAAEVVDHDLRAAAGEQQRVAAAEAAAGAGDDGDTSVEVDLGHGVPPEPGVRAGRPSLPTARGAHRNRRVGAPGRRERRRRTLGTLTRLPDGPHRRHGGAARDRARPRALVHRGPTPVRRGFATAPWSLAVAFAAVVVAVGWRWAARFLPRPELAVLRPIGRLGPWIPRLLGIHAGVSLLALAARLEFLVPTLALPVTWWGLGLGILEGIVGVWLIAGWRVRPAAWLLVAPARSACSGTA